VTVASADFVSRARSTDPRIAAVVDEHLTENDDELLVHLLIADFRRQAQAAHDTHDFALRDTLLALLDWGIAEGDEALDNAISISFVEDSGWWEPEMDEYLATWPPALTAELQRQRDQRT
jgi:hypothetical protein